MTGPTYCERAECSCTAPPSSMRTPPAGDGSARKGVCSIVALCVDNADNFTSISHCSETMCSNAMGMCSTATTNESVHDASALPFPSRPA